jgi:hypothetical protein
MSSKKQNTKKQDGIIDVDAPAPRKPNLLKLALLITLVYFVTLASLILVVHKMELTVPAKQTFILPLQWTILLNFTYYVLPFLMAVMFGVMFRPFWRNVRNVIFLIFTIHFIYSVWIYINYYTLWVDWRKRIDYAEESHIQVNSVTHKFFDETSDGLVDRVALSGEFDVSNLSPGKYQMDTFVTQRGERLPNGRIDSYHFTVNLNSGKTFKRQFQMRTGQYKSSLDRGAIDVDITLRKEIHRGDLIHKIINLSRWSAFFRATTWDGQNKDFEEKNLLIHEMNAIDSFSLIPVTYQRQIIFFRKFLDDRGEDADADDLLESMVLSFEVYSNYEGPIYLTGAIDRGRDQPFTDQFTLKKGFNAVKFRFKGSQLKALGFNGPYQLVNLAFSDQPFECEGADCEVSGEARVAQYLEPYITNVYLVDQFE